jgi:hypothetical protein
MLPKFITEWKAEVHLAVSEKKVITFQVHGVHETYPRDSLGVREPQVKNGCL